MSDPTVRSISDDMSWRVDWTPPQFGGELDEAVEDVVMPMLVEREAEIERLRDVTVALMTGEDIAKMDSVVAELAAKDAEIERLRG